MNYRTLSYLIDENTPVYGSTPEPQIYHYRQISSGDSSNSYVLTIHNHTGTHVDAPRHFIPDGRHITDYSWDELTFNNPLIIECLKGPGEQVELRDIFKQKLDDSIDCLILRTGFGRFRDKNQKIYRTQNPGILPEVILWLRKEFPAIRCMGTDSISISGFQYREQGREAHIAAFKKREDLNEPLLLIEDLNLNTLSAHDKLKKVMIIPWQISDIDSAPCVVLADVINNNELYDQKP